MLKLRNISLVLLILGLFILILLWSTGRLRLPWLPLSPLEAIPTNAPLVIDFPSGVSWPDTLPQSTYREAFEVDYLMEKMKQDRHQIGALLPNTQLLAVLQASGVQQFDFLYILSREGQSFSPEEVASVFPASPALSHFRFQGQKIYHWRAPKSSHKRDLAFCYYNNLLLIAPYALLIEDAIDQIRHPNNNLLQDNRFTQVYSSNTSNTISAYFGLHNVPAFLSPFFKNTHKKMLYQLEDAFSWVGFSLRPETDRLQLQGNLAISSTQYLLQNLARKNSGDLEALAKVLPDNTALLTWLNFAEWETFFRSGSDLEEEFQFYFHPWLGKDFAYVITEPYGQELEAEKFAVFRVADSDLARHYLEKYAEEKGELKNFNYQTYRIRQVLAGNLLRPIFGEPINGIHDPYYVQIGDYLIFSNARQSLEVWIDKYLVGQTLSRDDRFLQWQSEENSPSNGLFYIDPSHASRILLSFFKPDYQERIAAAIKPFLSFNQLAFSLRPKEGQEEQIPIAATLQFGQEKKNQTTIMWKTILSDTLLKAPQVCYNSKEEAYEIFVQDERKTIYLLNQGGDVLWQREMEEPLLSSVYPIDYYQNGQVQYLFNTTHFIHLIDQEGRDISNFPKALKSPATNGMLLVDFQGRKEYAYFLACRNGNIYGFSQTGSPLPGWNPKSGRGVVERPLQHLVYRNKDFILSLNKASELSAYKRNGSERFSGVKLDAVMTAPLGFEIGEERLHIVGADERGRLYLLNSTGDLFHLNTEVGKNTAVKFCLSDVLADEKKDYITMSEKSLATYTYTKSGRFEQVMNYEYEMPQDSIFEINIAGQGKSLIGSYNKDVAKINLLKGDGELYPGFPLAGSTAFVVSPLFGNATRILVVANGESIYAYKLE